MNVLVIGSGAIGSYFGGCLLAAGHDVSFVAREERYRQFTTKGIHITSICGNHVLPNIKAYLPNELMHTSIEFDVVLLAVKSNQLPETLQLLKSVVKSNTIVVSLLNGVHQKQRLIDAGISPASICIGIANIIVSEKSIGDIHHTGVVPHLTLEAITSAQGDTNSIVKIFSDSAMDAGVRVSLKKDIKRSLWQKFCFVAPWGTLASTLNLPIGKLLSVQAYEKKLKAIIAEYVEIALHHQAQLKPSAAEDILSAIKKLPASSTTSMQRDIEQGSRGEFDALCEYPYDYAKRHNIATPVLDECYAIFVNVHIRCD